MTKSLLRYTFRLIRQLLFRNFSQWSKHLYFFLSVVLTLEVAIFGPRQTYSCCAEYAGYQIKHPYEYKLVVCLKFRFRTLGKLIISGAWWDYEQLDNLIICVFTCVFIFLFDIILFASFCI